ncbi:MAG: hypothetical protein GY851_14345 [bacterium]|nr:hypothetical protein [bacterium]
MASCTRIDGMIQTYVDGRLSDSERVILEQHMADCARCASRLRRQKRVSAFLFETFSAERLDRSFRQSVLSHLPEMQPSQQELTGLNQRTKHQRPDARHVSRWVLASVLVFSLVFAAVLLLNWPEPRSSETAIGVVVQGDALSRVRQESEKHRAIGPRSFVEPGTELKTDADSSATVRLAGASLMRLAPSSTIHVADERRVYVEQGAVWLDVGSDGRRFRVSTPTGDVTVFGTVLSVAVDADGTEVTVGEGEVTVEQGARFAVVVGGQGIAMSSSLPLCEPVPVNADALMAWVRQTPHDPEADALCKRLVFASRRPTARGMDSYVMPIPAGCEVSSLCLEWVPAEGLGGYCGYDVYVMDSQMKALLRGHVPGRVFGIADVSSHELAFRDAPRDDVHVLLVRLVPDTASGTRVARDLHVRVRVDEQTQG